MKKDMTVTYIVDGALYINVTNRCTNNCEFCIRKNGDGAYGSDSLWLIREPSEEEILEFSAKSISGLSAFDFHMYQSNLPFALSRQCLSIAPKNESPSKTVKRHILSPVKRRFSPPSEETKTYFGSGAKIKMGLPLPSTPYSKWRASETK